MSLERLLREGVAWDGPRQPVDVVILDSGIDASHPDLRSRVVAAHSVESVDGLVAVRPLPVDTNNDHFGHGTAVASIIAALAPNARLIDLRVLGPGNAGVGEALMAGLGFARTAQAHVVNLSLACRPSFRVRLMERCEEAYQSGQVVVASERNIPMPDDRGLPATLIGTIGVSRASFTSRFSVQHFARSGVEFSAHGERVRVAAAGGGYTEMTGTSFAAPVISAMCARWLGRDPTLRSFDLKALLRAHAETSRFEDASSSR